jgi:phage terminase small subunit
MKKKDNLISDTSPLSPKRKRFCEEYIIDLNGLQAAIRAKYSKATAQQQSSRLLSNVKVQAYIKVLMDKRSVRTDITSDRVLQELAAVGFARIDDFLKVEEQTQTEALGVDEEGKPITNTWTAKSVNIFETDGMDKNKLPAVASIKQTKEGIELKLHDKMKSLELLGRHLGMWKDKIDVTTKGESLNQAADLSGLTDEELRLLAKIKRKMNVEHL